MEMARALSVPCLVFAPIFLTIFHHVKGEQCVFSLPCSCATSNVNIDLSKIMQDRGKPLSVRNPADGDVYYLNPCGKPAAACAQVGTDASGCQIEKNVPYGIASTTGYSATGDPSKGTVKFTYSYTDRSSQKRTAILSVVCNADTEDKFSFEKESTTRTYPFVLETYVACLPSSGSGSGGLSLGSVLLIIFFVLLIVYCIAGFLIQKFLRKAEGMEVIPNYEFWKDVPFLIKDGMVFSCTFCKGSTTYEKI